MVKSAYIDILPDPQLNRSHTFHSLKKLIFLNVIIYIHFNLTKQNDAEVCLIKFLLYLLLSLAIRSMGELRHAVVMLVSVLANGFTLNAWFCCV